MKKMTPEELEIFIHRQLRGLPARPAPHTLEARVASAIEQREFIPWYHQSWSHWPKAVRVIFMILASAVTGAMVAVFYLGFTGAEASELAAEINGRLGVFVKTYHVIAWVFDLGSRLFASVPTAWLYSGGTVIALLYATFLGLGTAAYRTLYRNN